jgi:hypothetical protein
MYRDVLPTLPGLENNKGLDRQFPTIGQNLAIVWYYLSLEGLWSHLALDLGCSGKTVSA